MADIHFNLLGHIYVNWRKPVQPQTTKNYFRIWKKAITYIAMRQALMCLSKFFFTVSKMFPNQRFPCSLYQQKHLLSVHLMWGVQDVLLTLIIDSDMNRKLIINWFICGFIWFQWVKHEHLHAASRKRHLDLTLKKCATAWRVCCKCSLVFL